MAFICRDCFRGTRGGEGVNGLNGKASKHDSTKTGDMKRDVLLTGDFLHLSFSILVKHVVSIQLYTKSQGCGDGNNCDVVMTCIQ